MAKAVGLLGRQEIEDDVKKVLSTTYKSNVAQPSRAAAKVKSVRPKEAAQ